MKISIIDPSSQYPPSLVKAVVAGIVNIGRVQPLESLLSVETPSKQGTVSASCRQDANKVAECRQAQRRHE